MTATEPGQLQGMRSERNAMPSRGARFFRDDDGMVSFVFVIDAGNIIGPRPANKADSEKHADEWAEFAAAEQEPKSIPEVLTEDFAAHTDGPVDLSAAAQPAPSAPEVIAVVPDAIERDDGPAVTYVTEKDMAPFVARIEPAPAPAKPKRKYTRRGG